MTADEAPLPGDVPCWAVPGWKQRFGVHAGVTGRGPGAAPFDLSLASDQAIGPAMQRWRTFLAAIPDCPHAVISRQVHGTTVLTHCDAEAGWLHAADADGHVTDSPGTLLLITVADCIPVYLVAPAHRGVALLHAGWRGTSAGILARGVESLCRRTGASARDIVMHCGVGICGPCYEVGREVMDGLNRPTGDSGPWHVDLRQVLLEQAVALGIEEATTSQRCSSHDAADFFSHRRSQGRDGRMVAFLGLPPRGAAPAV